MLPLVYCDMELAHICIGTTANCMSPSKIELLVAEGVYLAASVDSSRHRMQIFETMRAGGAQK